MPNHIKNRLTISGDETSIGLMLKEISTTYPAEIDKTYDGRTIYENKNGDYGWLNNKTGKFETGKKEIVIGIPDGFAVKINPEWTRFPDFNKVVEMPESLDLESNSLVEMAIKNSLQMGFHENELVRFLEVANREKSKSPLELNDKDWNDYISGLNNVRKYGFINWYEWSIENWGTKWNSYSCEKLEDNVFQFETAWSAVPNLIEKISLRYPTISILYEWSDEDIGSNCGYSHYLNGEIDLIKIKSGSKEAYEMAFKLHPGYSDSYSFIDGEYVYKEEDL